MGEIEQYLKVLGSHDPGNSGYRLEREPYKGTKLFLLKMLNLTAKRRGSSRFIGSEV